jgi:hypothetical protein
MMKDYDKALQERLAQLGSYDLAKLAYYGFWKKLLAERRIEHFDSLELNIKNAWQAAAEAVIRGRLDYETNKPI